MTFIGQVMALVSILSPVLIPLVFLAAHIGDKSVGAQRYIAKGAVRGGIGFIVVMLCGLPFILVFGP